MKHLLSFLLVFFCFSGFAQTFNGVQIDGKMEDAIYALKNKGYTVSRTLENLTVMSGSLQGKIVELYIGVTPKSKQVYTFRIFFPKQISWKSIKNEYDNYRNILVEKYGQPDSEYDIFINPYYLGDGYEMQAIRNEKCNYATFWYKKGNLNLGVEITKWEQVRLTYENVKLAEVMQRERSEIQTDIF